MSNNLKKIREAAKLSKQKLSQITGISPANLYHIEVGNVYPFPGWRKRISEALGVSEFEIFPECIKET